MSLNFDLQSSGYDSINLAIAINIVVEFGGGWIANSSSVGCFRIAAVFVAGRSPTDTIHQ